MANVLPRLPQIKDQLDLSNAALGAAVAAGPVGGLLAGGAAGWLIGRLGSGRLTVVTGSLYGVLLVTVGIAPAWLALAAAFLALGASDAVMDAGMNAHGIAVQRGYERSILHAFHGWWSAGTLVGAACGAVAAALDVPIAIHLATVGLVFALVSLAASRLLLRGRHVDAAREGSVPHPLRLVRVLAPIALIGVLGVMLEDAAQTWSTVYLADDLGAVAGLAAVAFVLYTATMTAGRLTNDRWIDRWGGVTVARVGALTAVAGLVLVAAAGPAGAIPVAIAGFVLVGAGTSPLFPIMVAAASSHPGVSTGHAVAVVSWLARGGFVIAPALIGVAADAVGLGAAFAIPLAAGLGAAVLAGVLLRSPAPKPA